MAQVCPPILMMAPWAQSPWLSRISVNMDTPGMQFHALLGDLKGYYAVSVSGNWRVIFRFNQQHVEDLDYVDYH